jgi:hypothetical protein
LVESSLNAPNHYANYPGKEGELKFHQLVRPLILQDTVIGMFPPWHQQSPDGTSTNSWSDMIKTTYVMTPDTTIFRDLPPLKLTEADIIRNKVDLFLNELEVDLTRFTFQRAH